MSKYTTPAVSLVSATSEQLAAELKNRYTGDRLLKETLKSVAAVAAALPAIQRGCTVMGPTRAAQSMSGRTARLRRPRAISCK